MSASEKWLKNIKGRQGHHWAWYWAHHQICCHTMDRAASSVRSAPLPPLLPPLLDPTRHCRHYICERLMGWWRLRKERGRGWRALTPWLHGLPPLLPRLASVLLLGSTPLVPHLAHRLLASHTCSAVGRERSGLASVTLQYILKLGGTRWSRPLLAEACSC